MADRKVRVLIADDEPHIRGVIAGIVASLGGEIVAEASDGEQAVALFSQTLPDMVILDINMPKLMGNQALKRMLAINPRTLAVMMTAQDSIDAVQECLDAGARAYILKSNPAEEIYRLIRESWAEYSSEILAEEAQ
jgi:DNA-binding NarL/FixJ family response regulator